MKRIDFVDVTLMTVLVFICALTIYPFLYVLAYSLSDAITVKLKTVTVYPLNFTLVNFKTVFENPLIYNAMLVTISRTCVGIVYALFVTGLAAYAIAKDRFPGKRFLSLVLIIPMYISGGLIPLYALIYQLGLVNNFLVFLLPMGFSAFNMLIMRTYFLTIPASLRESARLDGAGEFRIFIRIILPLSMPIVATISMFVGVWQWNSWFDGMLYITDDKLMPMATILMRMLKRFESSSVALSGDIAQRMKEQKTSPESIKMATVMIATIPIICIYPFLQKYFIKGVMIGAVKA